MRMSPELHKKLHAEAQKLNTSLNRLCLEKIHNAGSEKTIEPESAKNSELQEITGHVLEAFGNLLVGIALFGSTARGEETNSSDIDLLLVLKAGADFKRDLYRQWDKKIAPRIGGGREISPQFVKMPEDVSGAGGIWLETALEGMVLWEKSNRLSSFLRLLRHEIASGKFKRSMVHGHPFWVLEKRK